MFWNACSWRRPCRPGRRPGRCARRRVRELEQRQHDGILGQEAGRSDGSGRHGPPRRRVWSDSCHHRRRLLVAPAGRSSDPGCRSPRSGSGRSAMIDGDRRVRRGGVDVHRHVVVEGWQALLEQQAASQLSATTLKPASASPGSERLGRLTAGVAGVDHPADLRHVAVLGPEAVAVLRPNRRRSGSARRPSGRSRRRCRRRCRTRLVAPRADRRNPQTAVQQRGTWEDRVVDRWRG